MGYSTGLNRIGIALVSVSLGVAIASCDSVTTTQYQAVARTTYTWHVPYQGFGGGAGERPPRIEKFATTTLEQWNGQKPEGAVTGPDDRGLWWGGLPPRPTIDEMEQKRQGDEQIGTPELNKSVEYRIIFRLPGQENRDLPTRYEVYRQVVRSYEAQESLEFVLGPGEGWVENAVPNSGS
jgi:hypothetical protein